MDKETLENFRRAMLVHSEFLGDGGTQPVIINGESLDEVDVRYNPHFSQKEAHVYIPVKPILEHELFDNDIFSLMGS